MFPPIHFSLSQTRVWLFSAVCFVLPMRASYIYIFSALLLIAWIAEGHWRDRASEVLRTRLCQAFLAYYGVFVLAMLWTENTSEGWQMVDRQTPILLFLLFWSSAEARYRERYISAFLGGLVICALLAHYNWAQLHWLPDWPPGLRVTKNPDDTAPFVDRIMYTPILALGAYLSLRRALSNANSHNRILATLITGLFLSNLAFSGGRAGMVMFTVLCTTFIFERIKTRMRAFLFCVVLFPLAFFAAYNTQNYFAQRVDEAINDVRTFDQNPNTSFGLRVVYPATSFRLFSQHPFLGVGSGDFTEEYAKAKRIYWPSTPDTFNPHNQYLFTAATTGLLGLAALLSIFYFAAAYVGNEQRIRAMLIGFAAICMLESYLWRSNTALTFSAILAVLVSRNSIEVASRS